MVLALFRQLFSGASSPKPGSAPVQPKTPGYTVNMPAGTKSKSPTGPWQVGKDQIEAVYTKGAPTLPKVELWAELIQALKAGMPAGSRLVECEPAVIDGHPGLAIVERKDAEGSPITYIGRLIVPLRDRWWEFRITAIDDGTVDREAVVKSFMAQAKSGEKPGEVNSDGSKHDFRFPNHAVTRVRKILEWLGSRINFDASLNSANAFPLPPWSATPSGVIVAVPRSARFVAQKSAEEA